MRQKFTSSLFLAYCFLVTLVVGIVALPVPFISRSLGWRVTKVWARAILWGLRAVCGCSTRVSGLKNTPQGATIVASNHQSAWDMVALIHHLPKPVFIVKRELFLIPVFGWWVKAMGSIGIDRSNRAQAMRAILRDCAPAVAGGCQIVIFPEGTRTSAKRQKRYAAGVAALYSTYSLACIPFAHNSGLSWSRRGFLVRPGTIDGIFYAPITTGLPRAEFMQQLENTIRSAAADLHGPETQNMPNQDTQQPRDRQAPLSP